MTSVAIRFSAALALRRGGDVVLHVLACSDLFRMLVRGEGRRGCTTAEKFRNPGRTGVSREVGSSCSVVQQRLNKHLLSHFAFLIIEDLTASAESLVKPHVPDSPDYIPRLLSMRWDQPSNLQRKPQPTLVPESPIESVT